MEYLISNFPIKNGTKYRDVYYDGPFDTNSNLRIIDGEIANYNSEQLESMSIEEILDSELKGLYTFICYNSEAKQIIIKNDILGEIPTYYYKKDGKILISNNAWKILSNLKDDEIKFNRFQLNVFLYYASYPLSNNTIISDMYLLSNASIFTFEVETGSISVEEYWEFDAKPKRNISFEEALDEFDRGLNEFFEYIIKRNPGKIFGFGNSGGLDSRLVAILSRFHKFPLKGITIADIRPNYCIKSNTAYLASKIARKCGVDNYLVDYSADDYEFRNLLDIRNNFSGPCQIFKNPVNKIPDFDILLTGHEGLLIGSGYGAAVVDIPPSDLADAMIHRFKDRDDTTAFNTSLKSKLKTAMNILKGQQNRRFDEYTDKNLSRNIETKLNLFDEYLNPSELNEVQDEMRKFVDHYLKNNYSPVNIWRIFFLKQPMRLNYAGGFESLSRTKKTYYIYYPFAFSYIETWPREYLDDRKLLKKYLKKKAPDIGNLPGQDMEPLELAGELEKSKFQEYVKRFRQVLKKIVLKIRKKGLEYRDWIKEEKFQTYAREVINRPNPLFEKYLDIGKLKNLGLYQSKSLVKIVKLKKIFDIFYYKEQALLDREIFKIK